MDREAYRTLQQSEWIREQADRLAAGGSASCPIVGCDGALERYVTERPPEDPRVGLAQLGGVRCTSCNATSRLVAL